MKKVLFINIFIQLFLFPIIFFGQDASSGKYTSEYFSSSSIPFYTDRMWSVKDGEFMFSCDGEECLDKSFYSSIYGNFKDFTVSTKLRWMGKSETNGFGLYIRGTQNGYYAFWISKNKGFCLEKVFENREILYNDVSYLINEGYNDLRVTCIGPNIKCFINEVTVIDVTDYSSLEGIVGYICNGEVECAFDDFSVDPLRGFSGNSFNEVKYENFDYGTTNLNTDKHWNFHDGAIYHSIDDDGSLHWANINTNYNDCSISVRTKWSGGSDHSAFGLRFGNGYGFFISQNGYYELTKLTGSTWIPIVDWQKTNLVNYDYNDLKVTCSGYYIVAYLNGVQVVNVDEYSYLGGDVGIACSDVVGAYFDDFRVSAPLYEGNYNSDYKDQIISDDFSGTSSILALNNYWRLVNNTLSFWGEPQRTFWTYTGNELYDFSCTVNAAWSSGENGSGFGIAFGATENITYAFEITQNGYYKLAFYDGATWTYPIDETQTNSINTGYNKLQVTCYFGFIQCYINDTLVIDTYIDNYVNGKVGLFSCGGVNCVFDDFSISYP